MRLLLLVRSVLGLALHLVAAVAARLLTRHRCAACSALLRQASAFCPTCALTVEWVEGYPPRAAARFSGAVRAAILRLKYEGHVEVAVPLAHVALIRLEALGEDDHDAIVPIPLHPARLATRGFNQCGLVAQEMARRLGTPCLHRALRRVRATETQAALGREARLENVQGAFEARPRSGVAGKRVLLLDDVTTTGATLAAAKTALVAAGAKAVFVFAIAEQA